MPLTSLPLPRRGRREKIPSGDGEEEKREQAKCQSFKGISHKTRRDGYKYKIPSNPP